MKQRYILLIFLLLIGGALIMAIYDGAGNQLFSAYDGEGNALSHAYDGDGNVIFTADQLPVPTGDLTASQTIPLPDLYEQGKGFTCTGLAYDETTDTYLVGDIGILLPNSGTIQSQIVRLSSDFSTVEETIPLYSAFSNMSDVQGVCIDSSDDTIWFCNPSGNYIGHVSKTGTNLGTVSVTKPTGIAYSSSDDTFWILNYNNQIVHISKTGTVLETYTSTLGETLDQCFLDEDHGYLYITAGTNYSGRNNLYKFDISSHEQSIACTVDSYSVEGIVIQSDRMVIVNDGYYHSASDARNVANIYSLN